MKIVYLGLRATSFREYTRVPNDICVCFIMNQELFFKSTFFFSTSAVHLSIVRSFNRLCYSYRQCVIENRIRAYTLDVEGVGRRKIGRLDAVLRVSSETRWLRGGSCQTPTPRTRCRRRQKLPIAERVQCTHNTRAWSSRPLPR